MPLNRPEISALLAVLTLSLVTVTAADDGALREDYPVRIRIADGETGIPFQTDGATILAGEKTVALPAGAATIALENATPPKLRYHLIAKTFLPDETGLQTDFIDAAKALLLDPQIVTQGRRFETTSKRVIDNRMNLISVARTDTKASADRMKKDLEKNSLWCYIVQEVVEPGTGSVRIDGAGTFALPITLFSDEPMELTNVNTGYWSARRTKQTYAGTIEVGIGPDGKLMLIETIPLETYLLGVLPAEMPSEWPLESLKAQAVAARSEVLVNLAGKHVLDGYDFCGTEHCRAYLGSANGKPRTTQALEETRGQFLLYDSRIVMTVFSATCGGWTEDNETVWSGRAQPALRGVADVPSARTASSPRDIGVWKWLDQKSSAYCRGDEAAFRWRKSFTATELTAIVNKTHAVGTVRTIETGDRGVSGRLKSVKIAGSKSTVTVLKELPIRQAFGGLPSALFVVSTATNSSGQPVFTFIGAGRGHGVGLCQNGAKGMADAGMTHDQILAHYFMRSTIEKFH